MLAHELKIGQRIYDMHLGKWGTVILIQGHPATKWLNSFESDSIITYTPDDSYGECETTAECAYPLVKDRYFWGEDVCEEINQDTFDNEHDYEFFCPERHENCYEFEVSK